MCHYTRMSNDFYNKDDFLLCKNPRFDIKCFQNCAYVFVFECECQQCRAITLPG